tara:strand:+ start:13 stop:390 length:378 start_codon:yes stop_codon:yes gene_type:complete
MNFAVIFNDGSLSLSDFQKECKEEGWLPITVIRKDNDDNVYVPIFKFSETAHTFMCRNFNRREVATGIIILIDEDLKAMEEKGWVIERMKWPRKFKDRDGYQLDVEVFELTEKPELRGYSKAGKI